MCKDQRRSGLFFCSRTSLTMRSIGGWKNWATSAHMREIYTDKYYTEIEDLVTPLISGTWPGSSTLRLKYGHPLDHEVLKRFLPLGCTTVCCSQVEYALRTPTCAEDRDKLLLSTSQRSKEEREKEILNNGPPSRPYTCDWPYLRKIWLSFAFMATKSAS